MNIDLVGESKIPREMEKVRLGSEEAVFVRRIRDGEEAAFKELVERYQPKVFSIIWAIVRDRDQVEDIAQQVFAKVFFSIGSFDSRSSFYTWLYRITVNECYDFLRKKRARKLVYEGDLSTPEAQQGGARDSAIDTEVSFTERLEQRDLAMKLLEKLSAEERSLLLLKELEGYSVEELAAMTGLNENTVKVKLFRARQKAVKTAQRLRRKPAPIVQTFRRLHLPLGSLGQNRARMKAAQAA
jgi:RNA polymerase sigma-70 factor (ECF subfamily)